MKKTPLSTLRPSASIVVVRLSRSILVDRRQTILLIELFLLTLTHGIEVWLFGMASHPDSMSPVRRKAIARTVISDPVVPKCHVIDPPLEPNMRLLRCRNDFHQIPNNGITLGSGDTDDLGHEARVEEE